MSEPLVTILDDEPQIRADHLVASADVPLADPRGEFLFLGGGEQRGFVDLAEVGLEVRLPAVRGVVGLRASRDLIEERVLVRHGQPVLMGIGGGNTFFGRGLSP